MYYTFKNIINKIYFAVHSVPIFEGVGLIKQDKHVNVRVQRS